MCATCVQALRLDPPIDDRPWALGDEDAPRDLRRWEFSGAPRSSSGTSNPEASRHWQLRRPGRDFCAVLTGEPQRAFYGAQFGNNFPLFVHYGGPLWAAEAGRATDPDNEAQ